MSEPKTTVTLITYLKTARSGYEVRRHYPTDTDARGELLTFATYGKRALLLRYPTAVPFTVQTVHAWIMKAACQ